MSALFESSEDAVAACLRERAAITECCKSGQSNALITDLGLKNTSAFRQFVRASETRLPRPQSKQKSKHDYIQWVHDSVSTNALLPETRCMSFRGLQNRLIEVSAQQIHSAFADAEKYNNQPTAFLVPPTASSSALEEKTLPLLHESDSLPSQTGIEGIVASGQNLGDEMAALEHLVSKFIDVAPPEHSASSPTDFELVSATTDASDLVDQIASLKMELAAQSEASCAKVDAHLSREMDLHKQLEAKGEQIDAFHAEKLQLQSLLDVAQSQNKDLLTQADALKGDTIRMHETNANLRSLARESLMNFTQ